MTTSRFRPLHAGVLAGIAVVLVLAVFLTGRVAALAAGAGLLILALARLSPRIGDQIAARSTKFDAAFLAVLGTGVVLLAATADNI